MLFEGHGGMSHLLVDKKERGVQRGNCLYGGGDMGGAERSGNGAQRGAAGRWLIVRQGMLGKCSGGVADVLLIEAGMD